MSTTLPLDKPHLGRPRKFKQDDVLIAAGRVFWEKGYHAASIDDLCAATGVLRGSLYAAFGDKKGILLAALQHYGEARVTRLADSLRCDEPSLDVFRQALRYYTRAATDLTGRACLITNTAMEMIPQDAEVAAVVESIFRRMAALLAAEYTRGRRAGLFASDLDETTAGHYLLSATQGLRVLNKVFREDELTPLIDFILRGIGAYRLREYPIPDSGSGPTCPSGGPT
jgi:TetR/AcrR family transcriptional repressor of nem operon